MKYYAHFGHTDFILCLGYRADVIKQYFTSYDETMSNDFILSHGGERVELLNRDISDWRITFVDTGTHMNIAGRLTAIREHLGGEEVFLANYADGLCDLPLDSHISRFIETGKVASFATVRPTTTFHIVSLGEDGLVSEVTELGHSGIWMNGGFFVFRSEIFNYIRPGEDLVDQAFARLIREQQLVSQKYDGFWKSMDTFKDKQELDDLYWRGEAPWEVWRGRDEAD